MRTPITYYGGKQRLVRKLLPLIPKHRLYVEPFMGGGALFFAKEASEAEIINDLNGNVTNFYKTVKTDFGELKKLIDGTLHSRATYKEAQEVYNNPANYHAVKRAWAFWVVTNQGFSGKIGSWALGRDGKIGKTLANKRENFTKDYAKRLKYVQIESKDALAIIKQYDGKDDFFYVDPPYFNADCGHYKGYKETDYKKLLDSLSLMKGKFLLSSYPSEMLTEYAKKQGWKYKEIKQKISANVKINREKTEVLVWNYELSPAENNVRLIPVAQKRSNRIRKIAEAAAPVSISRVQKSFDINKQKRAENLLVSDKKSRADSLNMAESSRKFELLLKVINPTRKPLAIETLKTFEGFESMNEKEIEAVLYSIHTFCRIVSEYMLENDSNNLLNKAA